MRVLCDLCFSPNSETPGAEIASVGNLCLFRFTKTGEIFYGLMAKPGHRNDHLFLFPDRPIPDPDPDCGENLPPDLGRAADEWINQLYRLEDVLKFHPVEGHYLIENCKLAGWEEGPTRLFSVWLLNHCGTLVTEYER